MCIYFVLTLHRPKVRPIILLSVRSTKVSQVRVELAQEEFPLSIHFKRVPVTVNNIEQNMTKN